MPALLASLSHAALAGTVLASEDFEHPNQPLVVNCGNSLDTVGIATLWGRPGASFLQYYTVEGVVIEDPAGQYENPSGFGGQYAIGMLSNLEDDRLFLTVNARALPVVGVALRTSAIDIDGCGGPVGTSAPQWQLTLYDSPGGSYAVGDAVLDTAVVNGPAPADPFTFEWAQVTADLDASGATGFYVTLEFDLVTGGYAVMDDLSLVGSTTGGVYDLDSDRVADDVDNCPTTQNPTQADLNGDGIGDACSAVLLDAGACPGVIGLAAAGLTPNGRATFLTAGDVGGSSAPVGGPCGGLRLGLDASVRFAGSATIGPNGRLSVPFSAGANVCGAPLQVVDNATCRATNVVRLGP